jgi:hypothetical protein
MDDQDVIKRIDELVAEEHRLRSAPPGPTTSEERARLSEIATHLDQLWDLLRRRRARQEFAQDPDSESLRAPDVVEGYKQ